MNPETIPQAGEWTVLMVGYARKQVGSAAHRIGDDGRTFCGFIADEDRRMTPPPGYRRCMICSLSEVGS